MSEPLSSSTAPLPADVRADGAEGRKLYSAALGFEQMLVRTLAAQLTATTGSDDADSDGEDSSGDPASGLIKDQIPDALAGGVASNGGLGLAHDLYVSMKRSGT